MRKQRKINKNIFYPELSYKIVGILYETQNKLGRFCREKQYCETIEELLKLKKLEYKKEVILQNNSNQKNVNRADFIIENKIILEIKTKVALEKNDYFQIKRYLQAGNFKLGILINFHSRYLKPLRILNSRFRS